MREGSPDVCNLNDEHHRQSRHPERRSTALSGQAGSRGWVDQADGRMLPCYFDEEVGIADVADIDLRRCCFAVVDRQVAIHRYAPCLAPVLLP
jgi:hypothetical protein